jgi:uncharacterized protein (TIGR02246 family)
MRKLIVTISVCLLLGALPALAKEPQHDPDKLDNVGGASSDVENEKAIRKLYSDYNAAWNRHDSAALGNMWTIDGDYLEPDGTVLKGRAAVLEHFKKQHGSVFKDTVLSLNINDVWFITQEVALIDGTYDLVGAKLPDGTDIPKRSGHLTAVLLHETGRWWITASRLMIPAPLPYKK